jgi:hypothetical protein
LPTFSKAFFVSSAFNVYYFTVKNELCKLAVSRSKAIEKLGIRLRPKTPFPTTPPACL